MDWVFEKRTSYKTTKVKYQNYNMSRLLPTELCQMITSFVKTEYAPLKIMIGDGIEIHGNIENEYLSVWYIEIDDIKQISPKEKSRKFKEKIHRSIVSEYVMRFIKQEHSDNRINYPGWDFGYGVEVGMMDHFKFYTMNDDEDEDEADEDLQKFFQEAEYITKTFFTKILK